MKPLRALLAQLLTRLRLNQGSGLDLLPGLDAELADPRDRALARAMLYATLRSIYRYERWLSELLDKPLPKQGTDTESLLLLALASLDLGIDAEHAVVHQSVEATRALGQDRFANLCNAILRRAQRELAGLRALPPQSASERWNHPAWLIELLVRDWGQTQAEAILLANNAPAELCLRVNRRLATRAELLARCSEAGLPARADAELADAFWLDESIEVGAIPGFDQGLCSVQDGAAQLAVELLDLRPGQRVLDACAAPGGKLAHIAEREPALAALVACDVSKARLKRMQNTLTRLQLSGIDWRQGDARDAKTFAGDPPFDRILLDAPCSGTGVIRRHPDIRLLRQPEQLAALRATQANLLDRLFALLAPNGRLVYATCSVLNDENAAQIAAFLARTPAARLLPFAPWFGRDTGHGRQNFPGEHGCDGFFYALLERIA